MPSEGVSVVANRKRYNERVLCPMELGAEWWYTLPSVTRRRIVEETGLHPEGGALIGSVQDRLQAKGLMTLAARFMRAMQDAHDADEARAQESLIYDGRVAVGPIHPPSEFVSTKTDLPAA